MSMFRRVDEAVGVSQTAVQISSLLVSAESACDGVAQ